MGRHITGVSSSRRSAILHSLRWIILPGILAICVIPFLRIDSAQGQESLEAWQLSNAINKGKRSTPVPVKLKGKRAGLVYQGSYIVNGQGNCNECHTCPSYKGLNPYTRGSVLTPTTPTPINTVNYLAGGTPFGNIKSGNLTPDSAGLPGGMSYAQFHSVMQGGQDPHGTGRILQVMPWPTFRAMNEGDLIAIYEFLSAIPAAQPGTCTGSAQTGP